MPGAEPGEAHHLVRLILNGLRLQAWGVVCLLLGTILTAFW